MFVITKLVVNRTQCSTETLLIRHRRHPWNTPTDAEWFLSGWVTLCPKFIYMYLLRVSILCVYVSTLFTGSFRDGTLTMSSFFESFKNRLTVFSLTLASLPMVSRSYQWASDFLNYSLGLASDILAEPKVEYHFFNTLMKGESLLIIEVLHQESIHRCSLQCST